ncbi:hypothetical protein BRADI_3g43694v3 [Brachypodium distachyon]|uniref:Uncharacterized protein n=1 Tax=Brachypodium distachyon TaxID=15368 RepID=A0A2K2D309_BRADI|nr:hypothetical protein BRADI_3g43694v3 [Brachypodium distachyon]
MAHEHHHHLWRHRDGFFSPDLEVNSSFEPWSVMDPRLFQRWSVRKLQRWTLGKPSKRRRHMTGVYASFKDQVAIFSFISVLKLCYVCNFAWRSSNLIYITFSDS